MAAALEMITMDSAPDGPALISHGDIYYDMVGLESSAAPILFTAAHVESDKYSSIHETPQGYVFEEAWAGEKTKGQYAPPAGASHGHRTLLPALG